MRKSFIIAGIMLVLCVFVFILFFLNKKETLSPLAVDCNILRPEDVGLENTINKVTTSAKDVKNGIPPNNRKNDQKVSESPFLNVESGEEENLVAEFDALTDKWIKSGNKKSATVEDVSNYVKKFKSLPGSRQMECLQRALNLVPDENVMLLAGILLDKTMDKGALTLVFHDILNRDESVKKPIMKEIFKDKSHPCWADVAWILDVTGELPKSK